MYINPFPPVGVKRYWQRNYSRHRKSLLGTSLSWHSLGKLVSSNVESLMSFPGVYAFVTEPIEPSIIPIQMKDVVYVGKSRDVKKRLKDYIEDRKHVTRSRNLSKRKIRDSIRIMFKEYGDNIEVYYLKLSPDEIANVEDILITIVDPVFNSEQKLDENDFLNFERAIDASFDEPVTAFNDEDKSSLVIDEIANFKSVLGNPEKAF
ncbi:GIY-YIG nuclease family protein [Vibrio splendidus]